MPSARTDSKTLDQAAELNRQDPLLVGSLLQFPDYGQLVMTGDMHGHQRNFDKLKKYADLAHSPARHVILHELIHTEHNGPIGDDASIQLALQAARWKIEFPDQIHFMQSNHEMAQLTGKHICKGGRIVNYDFECNVAKTYGHHGDAILESLNQFISSFPLAGRTPNRVFLSHSLPNNAELAAFDHTVIDRPLTDADLREGGDAYMMVWGRHHPAEMLETLAGRFDVDWFICGHQPQEDGYAVLNNRMVILASDHNHGTFLPFDLKKTYTIDDLARLVRPFAAIA
jgi:Calcineurin-like phosphoesterase